MSGTVLHVGFDILAWMAAGLSFLWLTRRPGVHFPPSPSGDLTYVAVLVFGAGIGAFAFGTANLWLSHEAGVARSIEGAIAGAIVAVELYKRSAGVATRTGPRFALPLAVGFYGAQRFVWEFLKPYGALIGPFTLFHLLSAAILAYAVVMIATSPTSRSVDDRAIA